MIIGHGYLFLLLGSLVVAYIIGSLPIGLLVAKAFSGKDILGEHSGRTGATNVLRTAGAGPGLITAVFDVLKGATAVWVVRCMNGAIPWIETIAGLLAIVGHNYSVFLARREQGKIRFHGGAGGTPTIGAALALWPPSIFIIVPLGIGMLFGLGYASVATMSMGLAATLLFLWRALSGAGPWAYVVFGVLAEGLLLWSLRPNIQRLLAGTERLVGWRASKKACLHAASKDDKEKGKSSSNQ